MKLRTLLESKEALTKLFNSSKLKANIAYRIAKICNRFNDENTTFVKLRNKLISENSDGKNDDGNDIITDIKKIEKVNKQINDLLDEEIEINIKKINISEFDNVGLTPAEIMSISYLIESDEEE